MSTSKPVREKLFFAMHIPWNWAKQRPQFLTEGLQEYYDVTVFYLQELSRRSVPDYSPVVKLLPVYILPFQDRFRFIKGLNVLLAKLVIRREVAASKYIVVTHPGMMLSLPALKPGQKLFYDCMDDLFAFPYLKSKPLLWKVYSNQEKKLVDRAEIVVCSSGRLRDKMQARYPAANLLVVNNAVSEGFIQEQAESPHHRAGGTGQYVLLYIGTIAGWMDWTLIKKSLDLDPRLVYHFVGPTDSPVPDSERIIYKGPVPHDRISEEIELADILVMPFQVNELIESVDPVKLYEYISSGKPAIAVRYGESEKFGEHVYLYSGLQEYCGLVSSLIASGLPARSSYPSASAFCQANTWNSRAAMLEKVLTATSHPNG